MAKHYTIPFFIPHRGCPHRCIFCDQKKITAREVEKAEDVPGKIEKYISTMRDKNAAIEVGFFGGSFTALDPDIQESFLNAAQSFLERGDISGIRLSTRPDCIDEEKLKFLKKKGVSCIELGVQSMSDRVLSAANRAHTSEDTKRASRMIVDYGFTLVHQIMLGLPFSSKEDEYLTARSAKELGAKEARIYPLVVIKNTELAEMWKRGEYTPLSEEEAVSRSACLILYFETNAIKVIRCGLHPSEGLAEGKDLLAGPFHESFRLKAESRIFSFMLEDASHRFCGETVQMSFNTKNEAAFWGFGRENLPLIEKICGGNKDFIKKDDHVPIGAILIKRDKQNIVLNRETLANVLI